MQTIYNLCLTMISLLFMSVMMYCSYYPVSLMQTIYNPVSNLDKFGVYVRDDVIFILSSEFNANYL